MNKSDQHTAKHSLARAVALALFVLGGTSILAPAFATHELGHDEIARGKIGALEERLWSCENDFAPCKSPVGPEGAPGPEGPAGPLGPQGQQGDSGFDGPLADLVCAQGQTVAFDETSGVWECADVGAGGSQALIDKLKILVEFNASTFVFVTSETYTGNLVREANDRGLGPFGSSDGLAAGNALCQESADAADLPGTYEAWLRGVPFGPAINFSRFTTTVEQPFSPYVLPNGDRVADGWEDQTDVQLINAISIDEFGDPVLAPLLAWSGIGSNGFRVGDLQRTSCTPGGFSTAAWTSDSSTCDPNDFFTFSCGHTGDVMATDKTWTEGVDFDLFGLMAALSDCSEFRRLYCFGQSEALLVAP